MPYKVYTLGKSERARMKLQQEEYEQFGALEKAKISGQLKTLGIGGISPDISNKEKQKMLVESAKKLADAYQVAEKDIESLGKSANKLRERIEELEKTKKLSKKEEEELINKQKALSDTTDEITRLRKGQTRLEEEISERADQAQKLKKGGLLYDVQSAGKIEGIANLLTGGGGGGAIGAIANLLGAPAMVGAVATAAFSVLEKMATMPRETEIARGEAIEAFTGKHMKSFYGSKGGLVRELGYQEETEKAKNIAKEEMDQVGIMVPFIMKNIGSLIFNPDKFGAEFEKARGEKTEEALEGLKKQDPAKQAAIEAAIEIRMQGLQAQRLMGLSEYGKGGYYGAGGFANVAKSAGFTPDMMSSMAAQMQAGGGSTIGMRQLSKLGLQAERGLDLTNAGTVLGRLTGIASGAGGVAQSEQTFKRIFKEGVSLGIDTSDFREEQRKFYDITSQLIYKSSATTEEQAGNVVREFSRFLGTTPTTKELGEAAGAYKKFQEGTAETAGRGGALQFAGFLKDQDLKKLDFRSIASLMSLEESQVSDKNELVQTLAVSLDMDPKLLAEKIRGIKQTSVYQYSGLDPNKMKILKKLGKTGKLSLEEKQRLAAGTEEEREAFEAYKESETYVSAYEGKYGKFKSSEEREAFAKRLREGVSPEQAYTDVTGKKMDQQLTTITRGGDRMVQSFAAQSEILIKKLQELKDTTWLNAESTENYNKKLERQLTLTQQLSGVDVGTKQPSRGPASKTQNLGKVPRMGQQKN